MTIKHNLDKLRDILVKMSWEFQESNSILYYSFKNSTIFESDYTFLLPIYTDTSDFSAQLNNSLKVLISIHPELKKNLIILQLLAQAKNVKHKFAKQSKDWILREPESKYLIVEIPDIYIPKK